MTQDCRVMLLTTDNPNSLFDFFADYIENGV